MRLLTFEGGVKAVMPAKSSHFILVGGKRAIKSEEATEKKLKEAFPELKEPEIVV